MIYPFVSFTRSTSVRTVSFLNLSSLTNVMLPPLMVPWDSVENETVSIQVWCFLASFFLVCEWSPLLTFLAVSLCRHQQCWWAMLRFVCRCLWAKAPRIGEPLQGHLGPTLNSTHSLNRTLVGVLGLNNQWSKVVWVIPLKSSFLFLVPFSCFLVVLASISTLDTWQGRHIPCQGNFPVQIHPWDWRCKDP